LEEDVQTRINNKIVYLFKKWSTIGIRDLKRNMIKEKRYRSKLKKKWKPFFFKRRKKKKKKFKRKKKIKDRKFKRNANNNNNNYNNIFDLVHFFL
jgi:hypothetical protein